MRVWFTAKDLHMTNAIPRLRKVWIEDQCLLEECDALVQVPGDTGQRVSGTGERDRIIFS